VTAPPVGGSAASSAPADPAALLARRESAIALDRDGRFLHEGAPIAHPGIVRAFRRWLAVGPGGRTVLRASEREWCFVTVEDAAIWVESAAPGADCVELSLWDGTHETLDPQTLALDRDGVLRCTVRGLPARFTRHAQLALGALLEPTADGGYELPIGGSRFPVRPSLA